MRKCASIRHNYIKTGNNSFASEQLSILFLSSHS
uniref:Uncharacterized protein n=1 Tax=Ascaris lumbricoides TaxID=6252 RepID=A0A0M3HL26_ASCLU